MDADGCSSFSVGPPSTSSLAALISVELEADVSGIEYYLSLSDNLSQWQDSDVRFAGGTWSLSGGIVSVEVRHDLAAGRWRVVFGLPADTCEFARMKIRSVEGS